MSVPQESEPQAFERFACPGCSEEVDVPVQSAGRLVRCPYCSTDFFASAEHADLAVVDDTDSERIELDRASAFDKLRIKNHTLLRMSAVRARSWWMIGLLMGIFVWLQMLGALIIHIWVFHTWGIWPTLRLLVCALCWMFIRHAYRRIGQFQQEIEKSSIPEPTVPPDFSTLDNGSERWRQLENIR